MSIDKFEYTKRGLTDQNSEWEGIVESLDCADCAVTLARDIERLPGVTSASVNFATAKLKVEYDPKRLNERDISRELRKRGYGLGGPRGDDLAVLVIEGMDCADESSIIEKQLRKLSGVKDLRFNLVAGEVTVEYDRALLGPDRLLEEVGRTGMKGLLKGRARPPQSYWELHKNAILTTVSGCFILLAFGFSWMGYPHKITDPLYILAILTGGYFTARKAFMALRTISLDMNFLMTIAVLGAAAIEEWLEGATVIFLFSVANILQNYTMNRARNAIRSLMELAPNEVIVERNGREEKVSTEEIQIGEKIVVKPGEKLALDGRVVEGLSYVNQAPITGESMPVAKKPGDAVFAGTINQSGSLEVEVTHTYRDTTLSKIIHLVEEAQAQKAPSQGFVERFSRYYTPAVIGGAAVVALVPPLIFGYSFSDWFYRSLVLLIIACPCALVISTPVSIVSGLTAAARKGILIKGGIYLEEAGLLRVIAFDKTGTLTRGAPKVTDVIPLGTWSRDKVLRIAAAVESRSEHPLGRAIISETEGSGMEYPKPIEFQSLSGKGAKAVVDGALYYAGSHRLCEDLGKCSLEIDATMLEFEQEAKTAVILSNENQAIGIIGIADEVRAESGDAMERLKACGIEKIVMLTGDNKGTAQAIARRLPIDEYYAELMPEDKSMIIKDLTTKYGRVAMVGDGVNDAPAMAAAAMGIAMGAAGTDTALETADIALMADDLSKLPFFLRVSKRTLRVIKQNIVFSLLVKGVFITLATSGVATLWMAVAADMGASLVVIFNGLSLLATRDE